MCDAKTLTYWVQLAVPWVMHTEHYYYYYYYYYLGELYVMLILSVLPLCLIYMSPVLEDTCLPSIILNIYRLFKFIVRSKTEAECCKIVSVVIIIVMVMLLLCCTVVVMLLLCCTVTVILLLCCTVMVMWLLCCTVMVLYTHVWNLWCIKYY